MESTLPMTMSVITVTRHGLELAHLVGHDGLGETEFGDAVDQHAAGSVEGFKKS